MNLDELIKKLQEIRKQHGNLNVLVRHIDNDFGTTDFNEPYLEVSNARDRFGEFGKDFKEVIID